MAIRVMIKEIEMFLEEANQDYELTSMKVNAVMEAAKRELTINYAAAELKVIKESGSDSDLAYLYEEANNGLVETVVAAIKRIKEAIVKFFSDLKDKIISLFADKQVDDKLEKLEKKVKFNPFAAKKKIAVENVDAELKVCDEHLSKLAKLTAKLKSGQDVSTADVDEVEQSFMDKHGKVIGIGSALVVTVAGGIVIAKKLKDRIPKEISDIQKDVSQDLSDAIDVAQRCDKPEVEHKIASAGAAIAKAKANDLVNGFKNTISKIVDGIKGIKNTAVPATQVAGALGVKGVKESTGEDVPETDDDIEAAIADASDVKTEDGEDDPFDSVPTSEDDDSDPWDAVMKDLAGLATDDDDCDDDDCDDDDCDDDDCDDDDDTTFESAFERLLSDIDSPYMEKSTDQIFNDIMMESGISRTTKKRERHSDAFSTLMESIDDLF
jgi:hypothetical protein